MRGPVYAPHRAVRRIGFALTLWLCGVVPCSADVITDWDAKATASASFAGFGEREAAIVDASMFDAVNSITPRYRAYLVQEHVTEPTSPEAAAANAAAAALERLHPQKAEEFRSSLRDFLATLSAPRADVDRGVQLGEKVAARIFDARANDGATARESYRPRTQPGVYVPTAPVSQWTLATTRPFALERADQFRPGPPVSLSSKEWVTDYNEIKALGAIDSKSRTPEQTETARFWLMVGPPAYHPLAWQIVSARHMSLIDSAHFMAVYTIALTDAYIAVFDAKYHYEFWRPVTAIRNGGGNPETERDPSWQSIDATPMHPEYPCAHCIQSGTAAAVIELLGGGPAIPELSLTSSTAPGVVHRFTSLEAFTTEVANARIWAGFHYRSSTKVGTEMGREVGRYVATHCAPPLGAGR
ncbi:MAG TPA: vanadium-dependent haloperoxidase [Steroidobacteraceae bacterium]|nr:vanadium-dependent haloperoxidase [Steroidobacteraceae bacterium]